jgi:hypothetical protein
MAPEGLYQKFQEDPVALMCQVLGRICRYHECVVKENIADVCFRDGVDTVERIYIRTDQA